MRKGGLKVHQNANDCIPAETYDEDRLGRKIGVLARELFGRNFEFTIDVNLKEGIIRIVKQKGR